MNWIEVPPVRSDPGARRHALRKFGLVMAAALGVVGGLLAGRGRAAAPYVWGVAGLFLALGLIRPAWLGVIEPAWMKLAEVLGAVMSRVILTLAFILVITPLGLVRRLFAGDTLGLRPDPKTETYWVPIEQSGPTSRPDKPY
jgi:hypothetical protein